jgi:hypothetical protein
MKVRYIGMKPFPVYVGLALSADAFAREMKRLDVRDPPPFNAAEGDASTLMLTHPKHGQTIIVALDPKCAKGRSREQVYALLVHEATHVKQRIFQSMGEDAPGWEVEAYLVQHIAQSFMEVYRDSK